MDYMTVIEIAAGLIAGGGLVELFKTIQNKRAIKKAAELENIAKTQEIMTQKNGTVEEWEKLCHKYSNDIEYYRNELRDRDARLEEKETMISELRSKINDISSENTALKLCRCIKQNCTDREPPFGYNKIDIENGVLK